MHPTTIMTGVMAAMGAVDIGQCLPALHTDPELMERQCLGMVDQRRDGVDDADPDPRVGPRPGQLAHLSDAEAAGVQLVVHQRRVAAQRDGAYPITHLMAQTRDIPSTDCRECVDGMSGGSRPIDASCPPDGGSTRWRVKALGALLLIRGP